MFDFVRNHKIVLQIILGLIMLPFAFFGLDSYQRVFNSSSEVAEVAGTKITDQEFAKALRDQQERLSRALRGIDPSLLDTPEMRGELLEGLITQRLLTVYGLRNNLVAGDEQLRQLIATEPAFQENGKFSTSAYSSMLRAQGLTEQGFEGSLRQDIAMQQLLSGVAESGFVPAAVARNVALVRGEQREVSEVLVSPDQFAAQVKLAPEAVQAYYDGNKQQFQIPEQVRAEYVTLSADALAAQEAVPAAEVRKWYDDNVGAKSAERAVAKKKAEAVLAEVQKNPAGFADLAKKYSEDPGSKDKGGDLGFFGRGMMVKAFENAVWKMQPGQISGLVESDFGFHIIKLTAVKGDERQASHILIPSPQVKDFDAMRTEIERDLGKQRAGKKYAESAEVFSNTAYEQAESLQPLADKFKLTIQKSDWITRQVQPGAKPPFGNPKLLGSLFGDDALKNKRNTEAVEISPGVLVVARVLEHKPVVTRPLEEVRAEVVKILTRKEALLLAQKAGAEKLAALGKGEQAGLAWGAPKTISRDAPQGLKPEALSAVFHADAGKLPAYAGLALNDQGYAIYRVSRLIPLEKLEADKEKALRQQLDRLVSAQEYQAFVSGLRSNAKVEVNKAALEKKQQQ
jgi:peptidyl-prolyl cis-trans isomerase D